jgi:GNAT domain-containint protein
VPSPAATLFPTVTDSPAREFIAAQLAAAKIKTLILPGAGRFAAAAAAVPVIGSGHIHAYDTGLLPSLIGWLADPELGLDSHGITVPADLEQFTAGTTTPFEYAAGLMIAIKYTALPKGTAYMAAQARAFRTAMPGLRTALAGQLKAQAVELRGLHYDVRPMVEAASWHAGEGDPRTCIVIDLHGLKARSRAETLAAEARFWTPVLDPFDPKVLPEFLEYLRTADPLVILYLVGKLIPPKWHKLAATESSGSTDYVIANRDPGQRLVKTRKRPGAPGTWPLYAEQEITPSSEIGFACVPKDTALYYRDLMAHRLAGSTVSEKYYLCLVDGRVTSVLGLHFRDFVQGKTPYISETFGLTITSQRYARLGKLMMLALTSRAMLAFLQHTSPGMLSARSPAGVATSSPALHEEGKGSGRGVMKQVRRDPRPGGGFDLRYEAPWRDDTWLDVIAGWHARYAHIARPGWDGPRLDPPPPPQSRRTRRRQAKMGA